MSELSFPSPATRLLPPRRRSRGRLEHFFASLIPTVAALITLATLLLLVQTSGVATSAYEVRQLDQERLYWEDKVVELEAEIAAVQSLDRVEQVATEVMQMAPPEQPLWIRLPASAEGESPPLNPAERAPTQQPQRSTNPLWWVAELLDKIRP